MNVKLFTHTDLDGIGCEIVGRLAFNYINVTHCDYWNVNDLIEDFFKKRGQDDFDVIFITDISVNEDVAKIIDEQAEGKVVLIDHHATALWLHDRYQWAYVNVYNNQGKHSGTNLFYEYLVLRSIFNPQDNIWKALQIFVEKVRRYDTWEWHNIYNDKEAGELSQLLFLVGRKKFVDSFMRKFNSQTLSHFGDSWSQMFDKTDKALILFDNEKKDAYIKRKDKQMKRIKFKGYDVGVVFAEAYISELGNRLNEMHEDLKFIAIIDMGNSKVSLRTIHDDIDLGKDVAKIFGGGGHSKASGFQFDSKALILAIDYIFGIKKGLRKFIDKLVRK